jgi:mono/diheme cytochrome c family protein/glucose/arabinose dehydrogenase
MNLLKLFAATVFVGAAVVTASTYQATRQWPAGLQPVSDNSPVLSPEEEIKTFYTAPGYHLELVASEPMIQDPILIDWDPEGRMWAIELVGYMLDIEASREHEPLGRIVVLEDTNGDGRMDTRTVFADGLVLPRALKVLDHGVLVGEPPNLWLMKDANHDLKMDTKELVTDTYGRLDANVEHNANSLMWALDNWMYTSEVDMFLRLKNGKFEIRKTLSRGQWGATQDDVGRVYRNSNSSALHVDVVPSQYFMRNPALTRTSGSFSFLGAAGDDLNATWPVRPNRGVNRGYQTGVLRPDGSLSAYTAVAAPTVYRGDRLPAEIYGNVFLAEPSGNLVSRVILNDDGTSLRGRKAYERAEFIASTDERFRPVYLSSAPDGTLYVVDMYRGIIQHKGYITEYLHDQIVSRQLEQPHARGRIYRVVHDTTRRGPRPSLTNMTAARLVDVLSHPNGWWRDTAQRLLVERNDKSAIGPLRKLATGAKEPRTRLHALWTLDGMDSIDAATVTGALSDPSRDVRVSAIRLSERWLREPGHPMAAAVLKLVPDSDWAVRAQVGASLGELPQGAKEAALSVFLEQQASDPVAMDAALSGLKGSEAAVLERLLKAAGETPQRSTAITMLAATIVSGAQDADVLALFDTTAAAGRPGWQRAALLRGAEVALLGAAAPGSPAGGRGAGRGADPGADAPCPTCPGGRGGPGGAPAFARARGVGAVAAETPGAGAGRAAGAGFGGRGRGGARPALKLTREPALSTMTAAGDLAPRVAAVLARVEWPGKPGAAAAAAALSPAEQARFDAGRDVYRNLCIACHQANGQGLDKVAPALVGSELALGAPGIPIRILLNGKEGTAGLMPPLGSALSDDQIAAVLTYVRREWAQTGAPVDPAMVGQIRPLSATRTRPWTNDELARIGAR